MRYIGAIGQWGDFSTGYGYLRDHNTNSWPKNFHQAPSHKRNSCGKSNDTKEVIFWMFIIFLVIFKTDYYLGDRI